MIFTRLVCATTVMLLLCAVIAPAQTGSGAVQGRVTDPSGASIVGGSVTLVRPDGTQTQTVTNDEGRYSFAALAPGRYSVRIAVPGFAAVEHPVDVGTGAVSMDAPLEIAVERQTVEVQDQNTVTVEPTSSAGAVVLKGQDIEALADDPDDLASDLQALAGPAAGPNGGQIYIDGFTGGRLPPKESIREVRINSNPFSAEFDRLGFGRIEVFTKPGTDKFRGQAFFNFGDRALNTRNPFSTTQPDYRALSGGGNVSGRLTRKSSFFVDVERRNVDDNEIIVANVLDPSLNLATLNTSVVTPVERTTVSPRIDYQLSPANTLVARYTWTDTSAENQGVGQFSLPSRAYDTSRNEQTVQLTETAVLGTKGINEARFQYIRGRNRQDSDLFDTGIQVQGAFTGGGAPFYLNFTNEDRYEFQDNVSMVFGRHQLKFGGRVRGVTQATQSTQNFAGMYTFGGTPQVTSIENYRQTQLLLQQGASMTDIRALGYGPSQFSITGGDPLSDVGQFDLGLYVQDDWRLRQNLTVSAGLRYEGQNNIGDHLDLAPRIGIAWAPGQTGQGRARTVVRAGFGIFYDRFSEDLTLNAIRLNGVTQQQFVVRDPNFYPNVPDIETLSEALVPRAIRRVDQNLQAPYTMQWVVGLERQLPRNIMVAVNYVNSRGVHTLRSRNINAPLASGARPYGAEAGDIYLYESTGFFNQRQLMTNIQARLNPRFTLFGYYVLGSAKSDSDGAASFPANSYDLSTEYGRAGFDARHRAFVGGSLGGPWGLQLSPFIVMATGRPFDITLGQDLNNDGLFTERPAFATDLTLPTVVQTQWGAFDINPGTGQPIIPRNYGSGPGMVAVNFRLSRTWGWGERSSAAARPSDSGGGGSRGPRGGGGMRGGGMGGGMRGMFGGGGSGSRYSMTLSASVRNALNTVNLAPPVGDLSSPLFGESTSTVGFGRDSSAGNRRIELQLRFNF